MWYSVCSTSISHPRHHPQRPTFCGAVWILYLCRVGVRVTCNRFFFAVQLSNQSATSIQGWMVGSFNPTSTPAKTPRTWRVSFSAAHCRTRASQLRPHPPLPPRSTRPSRPTSPTSSQFKLLRSPSPALSRQSQGSTCQRSFAISFR